MSSGTRCILTVSQVLDIFRLKKSKTAEFTSPSGVVSAKIVGQYFQVSSKTVRDIWMGRTWYRATHHLEPTRSDAQERLDKRPGRPKGAKDRKPRIRKIMTLSSDYIVGSRLVQSLCGHSESNHNNISIPSAVEPQKQLESNFYWTCGTIRPLKCDPDIQCPSPVSRQPSSCINARCTAAGTPPLLPQLSQHTRLFQPTFDDLRCDPPPPPAAATYDFGDPFHDDWKHWA